MGGGLLADIITQFVQKNLRQIYKLNLKFREQKCGELEKLELVKSRSIMKVSKIGF